MAQVGNDSSTAQNDANDSGFSVPPWAQAVLKHGADLGTKLISYQQYQGKVALVDNAAGLLTAPNVDIGQRINNFLEFQNANSTIVSHDCFVPRCGVPVNNLPDFVKGIPPEHVENLQKNMLESLNDLKQQMANNFVLCSAAVSASIIVVQIVKMYNVWKEIKKAENLHKDQTKFLEIEQNINEFESLCTKLNEVINRSQTNRIVIQSMKLSTKYTDTMQLICDLKVKINGTMQRLDLAGDGQIYDGISNIIMAGSNAMQLAGLFKSLSSPVAVVGSAMIALFSVLVVGNAVLYTLTQKRLDELRNDYKQLIQYELQLKKLNADIQRVLEEQEHNV